MNRKILVILMLFFPFLSWHQGTLIRRVIIPDYSDVGGTIFPTKLKNESIRAVLFDGRVLKIQLDDYRGRMYLKCYSEDSILLEEGGYLNSLDLLKKTVEFFNPETGKSRMGVAEFYQPLKSGKWKYYNSKGKLVDSVFYNKGIKDSILRVPKKAVD